MRAAITHSESLGVHLAAERLWVASDVHGMCAAFVEALRRAGLIDTSDHWTAPAGTALVVLGDVVDRGANSRGVLELLFRLRTEAAQRGGLVLLLRGNHEAMMTEGLAGHERLFNTWLTFGGLNTLTSLGIDPRGRSVRRGPASLHHAVRAAWPGLLAELESLPEWAIWNDVLLTHGGPVPHLPLASWKANGEHLWQRQRWAQLSWSDPAWDAYRALGLERFVMGHTPMDGLKTFLDGRLLAVDTNACGVWDSRHGRIDCELSLVEVPASGDMRAARSVVIDTAVSPERFQPIDRLAA